MSECNHKTYKVSIYTVTQRNKRQEVAQHFVTSTLTREEVGSYYYKHYQPLNTDVSEVETLVADPKEAEKSIVEKLTDGGMYSSPSYRFSRDSLPKDVQALLDELTTAEQTIVDTKKRLTQYFGAYLNDAQFSKVDRESVTVNGYLLAMDFKSLKKVEKDNE